MAAERILIVDDEASVREVVAALLQRSGYRTVTASGGLDALQIMQGEPAFDLILSDIMMPGMDGLELLDQIGIHHPGTPVIVCSAVHDIHGATNAFRRGAIDYLLKPFDRAQLLKVITRGLEHSRFLMQNAIYRENLEEMVSQRTEKLRATMLDLERSYDITLQAMGDALDLRDAETEGHSRRVTAYTIALAREMGVGNDELRTIARGAFLHDIGKIATPDRVLLKPGKLDAEEMAIMREHCERGYDIVRKIPFLRDASEIVYSHQESFDGSGYPRGLAGDDIPLGARIFAIADTLDAITSDRPYRKGASFEAARDEIARCSGKQFDPIVVEVFLQVPIERWHDIRIETSRLSATALFASVFRPESS